MVPVREGQRLCSRGVRKVDQDSERPGGDFGDDTPSRVKAYRYMTGHLPLGATSNRLGAKIEVTRCPHLPGTSLTHVSIMLSYLIESPPLFSKMSQFGQ